MARNCSILVSEEDLGRLAPGHLLNDLVLDSYLREVERRSNDPTQGVQKVLCLDSAFLLCLEKKEVTKAASRFRRVNPFNYSQIFVPLHMPGGSGHWALIVAEPPKHRVSSYDSLGLKHEAHLYYLFHALQRYAKAHDIPISPENWHMQDTSERGPRQTNGVDCGVFVTWFAERLARNQPLYPLDYTFAPNQWREHVRRTLTGKRLLTADAMSSEFEEFTEWELLEASPPAPATEEYAVSQIDLAELVAAIDDVDDSLETPQEAHANKATPQSKDEPPPELEVMDDDWFRALEITLEEAKEEVGPAKHPGNATATSTNTNPTDWLENIRSCPSPCLSMDIEDDWLQDDFLNLPTEEPTTVIEETVEAAEMQESETTPPHPKTEVPTLTGSQPKRLRRRNKKRTITLPDGQKLKIPRKFLLGY